MPSIRALLIAVLVTGTPPVARAGGPGDEPPGAASAPGPQDDVPVLLRTAHEEEGGSLGVGDSIPDLQFTALDGSKHTLSSVMEGRKGLVIAMSSSTCPTSSKYGPRLASMEREYAAQAVPFIFVNAVEAETPAEIARQIRKLGLKGLYLPDRGHTVAAAVGARTTTEVFVLDPVRTLLYRGAVDDQYGISVALDGPRRTFLRDALDAMLAGKRPAVTATWSPGCLLDLPTPARRRESPSDLTYYGRIAGILADNCVSCHRAGGAAPFALDSLPSVQGRITMLEAVLRDGLMPPSHGVDDGEWRDLRVLPAADRADLLAWLGAGSKRQLGTPPTTPAPPRTQPKWEIGEPDQVLYSPAAALPAQGPLKYSRGYLATNFDADRWVTAMEMRPVERDSIQHALVWIVAPGDALPAPEATPATLQFLGSYSPSDPVRRYPTGLARSIPAGSLLLVELYARPMGKAVNSSLRIALATSASPAPTEVRTLTITPREPTLALDGGPVQTTAELALDRDVAILSIRPYMRSRGREFELEVAEPGAQPRTLLRTPRYDFRWQIPYQLAQPLAVAAGSRLMIRATHRPLPDIASSAPIRLGPGADEEAALAIIEFHSAR